MQPNLLSFKWSKIAPFFLIGGALAWAVKLGVIISTNGRVIDTGAAALMMTVGIVALLVGSTGIGNHLSFQRPLWLRVIAIVISPVVVLASFLLIGLFTNPLFENSSIWYAQQEAPIAGAVLVYLTVGFALLRRSRSVYQ